LVEVGDRWARGELAIRHEHLVSEALERHLRDQLGLLSRIARGQTVVFACLPDEQHSFGLYMVALEAAAAGLQPLVLGRSTPPEETAEAARTLGARAVGLSVSAFSEPRATRDGLNTLRRLLPERTAVWAGGGGVADLDGLEPGIARFGSLDELDATLREITEPAGA
jgi:methanogenic corrinoid protein MtbC1